MDELDVTGDLRFLIVWVLSVRMSYTILAAYDGVHLASCLVCF
jgi:hypothetical protein